jgi:hypothetical protein
MTDGALPTPPTAVASPVSGTSPWKLYLAAAIGAFLLGLSDYFRNGSDSTVMVLNNGLVAPVAGLSLVPVILLATPFLGVIAAWIYRPSSERDAFALGFAVFSLFALGPEDRPAGNVETIQVSTTPVETGSLLVGTALAARVSSQASSTTILLAYEGAPPSNTEISVRNLTKGQWLGSFQVQDRLELVGDPGDRVELAIEAPGYERTGIELTLDAGTYTVELKESGTPLFVQRLTPAVRTVATPSEPPLWTGADAAGPVE